MWQFEIDLPTWLQRTVSAVIVLAILLVYRDVVSALPGQSPTAVLPTVMKTTCRYAPSSATHVGTDTGGPADRLSHVLAYRSIRSALEFVDLHPLGLRADSLLR